MSAAWVPLIAFTAHHLSSVRRHPRRAASRAGEALLLLLSAVWFRPCEGFFSGSWLRLGATPTQVHNADTASTLVEVQRPSTNPRSSLQSAVGRVGSSRRLVGRNAAEAAAGALQTETGLAIAALSAFFNGSFPACSRLPREEPDPVIFNGIVCLGVFLSSVLLPLGLGSGFQFTLAGSLGGALFVFAALCSFLAIPRAGLATAQAVWSCSAIAVAFTWGAFGPAEVAAPVKDLTFSFAALSLLVAGALIIVTCSDLATKFGQGEAESREPLIGQEDTAGAADRVSGLGLAASVGLFGGSILVPLKFVPAELSGLECVPSFGLGALVTGALVTAAYLALPSEDSSKRPEVGLDTLGAGVLSGAIWNAGNICSIVAQEPPFSLSYGIAYPILQCALFFGGLWGIYVFKEIKGFAVNIFWAGALVLVGGILLLASYGPGAA